MCCLISCKGNINQLSKRNKQKIIANWPNETLESFRPGRVESVSRSRGSRGRNAIENTRKSRQKMNAFFLRKQQTAATNVNVKQLANRENRKRRAIDAAKPNKRVTIMHNN